MFLLIRTVFQRLFVLKVAQFGRDAPSIMEHAASSMKPIFRRRVSPHRALPELHSVEATLHAALASSHQPPLDGPGGGAAMRTNAARRLLIALPAHAARKCFKATARQHTRWSRTRLESTLIPSLAPQSDSHPLAQTAVDCTTFGWLTSASLSPRPSITSTKGVTSHPTSTSAWDSRQGRPARLWSARTSSRDARF